MFDQFLEIRTGLTDFSNTGDDQPQADCERSFHLFPLEQGDRKALPRLLMKYTKVHRSWIQFLFLNLSFDYMTLPLINSLILIYDLRSLSSSTFITLPVLNDLLYLLLLEDFLPLSHDSSTSSLVFESDEGRNMS